MHKLLGFFLCLFTWSMGSGQGFQEQGLGLVKNVVELPRGKGVWFYVIPSAGNPKLIAKGIQDAGCTYVLLKFNEGSQVYEPNIGYFDQLAQELHQRHIRVYAWGFNYAYPAGTDPEGNAYGFEREAEVICEVLKKPYISGYVFNGEDRLKIRGNARSRKAKRDRITYVIDAVILCRNADPLLRRKPIGWSTHGQYNRHQSLPADELLPKIDFLQPQIYWKDFRLSPKAAVELCVNQWREKLTQLGVNVPIVATGQTYRSLNGGMPTRSEMAEFAKAARAEGCLAADLYRYPQGKGDRDALTHYDEALAAFVTAWGTDGYSDSAVQVPGFWFTLWAWIIRGYWHGLIASLVVGIWLMSAIRRYQGRVLEGEQIGYRTLLLVVLVAAILWPLAMAVTFVGVVYAVLVLLTLLFKRRPQVRY